MSSQTQTMQPAGGVPLLPAVAVVSLAAALGVAIVATGHWAVVGLIGVIAFVLFVLSPVSGLYITTALLLLSGSFGILGADTAAVPVTAAKLCGLMTLLAWAIDWVVRREPLKVPSEVVLLVLFYAWSSLGLAFSEERAELFAEWFRLGTLAAFFILSIHLLDTKERMHAYVVLIAVCGLLMSLVAIAQYFLPALQLASETAVSDIGRGATGAFVDADSLQGGPAIRVSGMAGHSNWLAMILLLVLPLNVYWALVTKKMRWKTLAVVIASVEFVALILTFTRTGFIVGMTAIAIVTAKRLIRITPQRITALVLAIFFAWLFLPSAYKERVLTFAQYTQSESVIHRTELQQAAFNFMVEKPIYGVGIGGFGFHLLDADYTVSDILYWLVKESGWNPLFYGTHNMYLQIGSETGLVGLALFILFLFSVLRNLRQSELAARKLGDRELELLAATLEVSLWSFALCAVFLHALQQKIWWMLAALATALHIHLRRNGFKHPGASKHEAASH
jgi:O-antigen ligase